MMDKTVTDSAVNGSAVPGFERVVEEFGRLLDRDADARGQFCAYWRGRQVVDLWGGDDVAADDIQGVFSSTKGAAGVCVALLVQRGALDLDAPVSRYWPEFAGGGKGEITVRLALSHQAGIPGVEPQLSQAEVFDHETAAARLASQVPHWRPGAAHGYHGFTIGTIINELVRRIEGISVADFFRKEVGEPRGIDFYIRTSEEVEPRVRMVLPMIRPQGEESRLDDLFGSPDSITGMTVNAAVDPRLPPLPNDPAVRASGQAAVAGLGSARGLARLYAMCISEVDGHPRLLTDATLSQVTQIQAVGEDLVQRHPNRFAIVFQKASDHPQYRIGSHQAFGHSGAGGSIGVADPWHSIAYGWLPRRMAFPGGADIRGLTLANTLRECVRSL